jgi:hypothetical protein
MVTLGLEFVALFTGLSLLYVKINLTQTLFHISGCVLTIAFILGSWHYKAFWTLWGIFGIIPFLLDILVIVSLAITSKKRKLQ